MLRKFLSENLRDLGIGGRNVVKWTLKKQGLKLWAGFI
jgi:hypothetical protein